jgi:very-short-patch-repair endonuclease
MKNNIVIKHRSYRAKILFARELRRRMTPAEIVFWKAVQNRGLLNLKFRRQQVIDGFIVDFYCHSLNLAIELYGKI